MEVLNYMQSFLGSVADFLRECFSVILGIFTLIGNAFPPVFISLFMFAVVAFIVGVIIRLL